MKTPQGLKTVMSLLAEEEESNIGLIAAFSASHTPAATPAPAFAPASTPATAPAPAQVGALERVFPATSIKLNSILKGKKQK